MTKQRIAYLDMAKGIGIILVVIGHSTYASADLIKWITSFHMPLFFIVSGMLIFHTQEERGQGKETIIKKAKSIMLPYLSFSILYVFVNTLYYFYDPITMPIMSVLAICYKSIILMGSSVLWFLPSLFLGEIIFLEIRRRTNHRVTVAIVFVIGILGLLGKKLLLPALSQGLVVDIVIVICRAAMPVVLLAIGYYIMKFMKNAEDKISVRKQMPAKELALALLLLIVNILISHYNGVVDLSFMIFNNDILFLIGAISGTMAVVLLCKNMKVEKLIKGLSYFGRNSLIIMATHIDFYVLLIAIKISEGIQLTLLHTSNQIVIYVFLALSILVMEIVIIYGYNRWFPFLLGKEKPKV